MTDTKPPSECTCFNAGVTRCGAPDCPVHAQPSNVVPLDPVAPDGFTRAERREVMAAIAANKARAQPAAAEVTHAADAEHYAARVWAYWKDIFTSAPADELKHVADLFREYAAHAQGAGVLERPLEWRACDDEAGIGWSATVGPYLANIDADRDHKEAPFAWSIRWADPDDDSGTTLLSESGDARTRNDADAKVRAAIRKHLSDAGLT